MKPTLIAAAFVLLVSQARAADPELSTDTKRMLAYGTLAVMTGACQVKLTPAQSEQLNSGLEKASQAQHDLTEADFTEAMKAVGTQVGTNRAQICPSLTPDFIATSLKEAEAGE